MANLKFIVLLACIPAVLSVKLGDSCKEIKDCGELQNVECNANKCACKPNYLVEKDQCVAGFGATCDKATDCQASNTQCVDKKCTCNAGHSPIKGECVPKLKSQCKVNSDCKNTANSECQNSKCKCKKYHIEENEQCLPGLGAACENTSECKASYTECNDDGKKCQCRTTSVADPDEAQCLPILEFGKRCNKTIQCATELPNTQCHSNGVLPPVCECIENYYYKNNKCVPKIYLGDVCTDEGEICHTSNSKCKSKKCACEDGHFDDKKGACVKQLESACEKDEECTIPNSSCQGKKCQCKAAFYKKDEQCLAGIEAECEKSDVCLAGTTNTECNKDKKCQCKENHVVNPEKDTHECLAKSKYNETCTHNVQCSSALEHSECTGDASKKCTCEKDFPYNEKDAKCTASISQALFFLLVTAFFGSKLVQ